MGGSTSSAIRIAYVVPGAGEAFYCENCLRDATVLRPLRERGHTVVSVPMYLPLEAVPTRGTAPVFFGAVGLYMRHRVAFLADPPAWMTRLLDSDFLLRMASRRAGSTRASGLEQMTVDLLEGEAGTEASEVQHLAVWLREECRPDVVHLSNALLLGLARRIRETVGVPVVCSLQDEDTWLDGMREPERTRAWELARRRAADVARFLPVSAWFGELMRHRLGLEAARLEVVSAGVDVEAYSASSLPRNPPVIGYLSRMSEELGLGRLVDAFLAMRRGRPGSLRLCVMGGSTADDRLFLRSLRARLASAGASADVTFVHGFGLAERVRMLESLSVLSVPFERGEALGSFLLEAMAAGVPVVQPRAGGYPELIESTGGGILYEPGRPGALEEALAAVIQDGELALRLSRAGRAAVRERFGLATVGAGLERAYRGVLHGP